MDDINVQPDNWGMTARPKSKRKTYLRHWRKHAKLTQEAAASKIGTDRTNLSKIERGLVNYTQPFLEAAADAYGCDPPDLLMRDPANPVWALIETVRQLPEAQQRQVIGIIRGFLASSEEAA